MVDQPFATAFFATYDPKLRRLAYASAGHPPSLLGTEGGRWQWLSEARSTPLGLQHRSDRPQARVDLPGPATLIVFSDGVVERAGEIIDVGLARVFDAVVSDPEDSLEHLLDAVSLTARHDDAVFVRISLNPCETPPR